MVLTILLVLTVGVLAHNNKQLRAVNARLHKSVDYLMGEAVKTRKDKS